MAGAATRDAVSGAIRYPQDTGTAPLTIVFVALWLAAAALFRKAAG